MLKANPSMCPLSPLRICTLNPNPLAITCTMSPLGTCPFEDTHAKRDTIDTHITPEKPFSSSATEVAVFSSPQDACPCAASEGAGQGAAQTCVRNGMDANRFALIFRHFLQDAGQFAATSAKEKTLPSRHEKMIDCLQPLVPKEHLKIVSVLPRMPGRIFRCKHAAPDCLHPTVQTLASISFQ